ncbi:MAG: hypothetical protein RLZZ246_419 [Planctomycetota bacterium]|jgi:alpha-tubulin suppressor-like RCC1 family protein
MIDPRSVSGRILVLALGFMGFALSTHGGEVRGWGRETPLLEVPSGVNSVKRVVAGKTSTLAIRQDGTVAAWGTLNGNPITIPSALGPVSDISVTHHHVAAVRQDGSVLCWGDNQWGQCNTPEGLPPCRQVGAGWWFTVALGVDGALRVWTSIQNGLVVPVGNDFVKIAVADEGFLALRADGTLARWGWVPPLPASLAPATDVACTRVYAVAVHADGTVSQWSSSFDPLPALPATVSDVVRVTCGEYSWSEHTVACCGIRADGSMVAWSSRGGWAWKGPEGKAVDVEFGQEHWVVARTDGSVECRHFVLGAAGPALVISPPVDLGNDVVQVVAGEDHSLALRSDGSIVEWGPGMLGGTPPPAGPGAATQLDAVIYGRAIALRENGTVFGIRCGSTTGWCGQVNAAQDLSGVVQVACGPFHALALLADGTVRAWGDPYSNSSAWTVPPGLSGVRQVKAGNAFSYALREDGSFVRFGSPAAIPVPADLGPVSSLSCGIYHTVGLRLDGTVRCWDDNRWGQCNMPAGLTEVVAVSAGNAHSLALRGNGTVIAWGYSENGETNVPPDLRNVRGIEAGWRHSLAIVDGSCVGDLDRDGAVMGSDLGLLLSQWGQVGAPRGDVNADGVVNSIDLGMVIGSWGVCPE